MYANQITVDMAAAHNRDLMMAAEAHRLARQVRRAERRTSSAPRVRRIWVRSATQPAHI